MPHDGTLSTSLMATSSTSSGGEAGQRAARAGEGARSAGVPGRGGDAEGRPRRRSAPSSFSPPARSLERSTAPDERQSLARFLGDGAGAEVETGEQHAWPGDVLQSVFDAATRWGIRRDGSSRAPPSKRGTPRSLEQRRTPVRSLRRGSPRGEDPDAPLASAAELPASSAARRSLRSSAPAGLIDADRGHVPGVGSQRPDAVDPARDGGIGSGVKRGAIISPARVHEHIRALSDSSHHQHMHNSHKLVLRAFLASDARDKGISDLVGILKLGVGDMPRTAHDSPLHDQTLVFAPDKRSEAVSAKAAMRGSRSPCSRTFFIHAVDPSNAQSWILEVVLQIERNAQSTLVKHYQVRYFFISQVVGGKRCTNQSARMRPPENSPSQHAALSGENQGLTSRAVRSWRAQRPARL